MAKELKKKTKTVSGADSKGTKVSGKATKASKTSKTAKVSGRAVKAEAVVPKAKRGSKRSVELKKAKAAKMSKTTKTSKVSKNEAGKGKKRWLLALAALVLVIAGGITAAVCLWEHEVPDEAVEIIEEEPAEPEPEPEPEGPAEGDEPLVPEAEMEDWSAYTVAPNKPRFLTITALGLYNIPIIEVGTTNGGAMGAPNSSFTVGWYYRSAYPGRVGTWATVIDGHGGSLGDGIFRTLPNIGVGAEVVIEMGDGRKFTYTVSEKVLKPKGAEADAYMKIADRPVDAETPTLTLITCTGDWIRAEQTYTHRLFVRAVMK